MGNWHISIDGVGAHHQHPDRPLAEDANRMAAKFVEDLKAAGHQVNVATFTHGAADDINEDNSANPYYQPIDGRIDTRPPNTPGRISG